MNIPGIYLVEPYNAYTNQQGGRKKHWHDIIEEQALMARIQAEHQALMEAQSRTLPPNSPNVSQAVVGNNAAGAGCQPVVDFFYPLSDIVNFSATPTTGAGPLTVQFTNLTTTQYLDSYTWDFGDGTTSTEVNPTHVYQSGSSATGYTVQLTASHFGGSSNNVMTSSAAYISASKPTVTAGFTIATSSNSAPSIVTFTNTSVNTSQTPSTTYLWTFGSGSLTSSLESPSAVTYSVAGPYTSSLQVTGSYGITSYVTRSFRLV